ncbi:SdiA-regulated domain-containing protein [Pseudomonas sp. Milli4]|uniref:SdiA-regulated domain-containing protein n=2 Tax=Pseudomonas schmalbachii TaxID=2816993 RepID=A0ABS3TW10_9PSED|nr:SdiA-regulated domain-containing protein [Pseudomonas schmalbachii]
MNKAFSPSRMRRLWLAFFAALIVFGILARYFHWDDRAELWLQEQGTSQQVRDESIWLPGYRAVIQGKQLKGGLEGEEPSDLAYNPLTRTLFTVTGTNPMLAELSLDGEVLRVVPLLGMSNPEGVAVLENGNVAVTDERRNTLTIFRIDPQSRELRTERLTEFDLGIVIRKNKGFEGIAWDPRQQRLLLGRERDPKSLFSWSSDGSPSLAGSMQPLPSEQLYMRNVSALSVDPRTGHALVLSAESHLLLELDENGEPVSFISLLAGLNGLNNRIPRAEGVAIDENGTIYMVSEPDLFYVFRREPAEGEISAAANQAELKVGLSAISDSFQQSDLSWTHRNQPGG